MSEPPGEAPAVPAARSTTGTVPTVSGVRSIDRAMAILGTFDEHSPRRSLSEIAEALGLNTSTTHRLLQALKAHGLVSQPDGGKAYALGPALLHLARLATGALDIREIAQPLMRRLRDEVDETVGLHVLRPDLTRSVIDQAESRHPLRRTYTELGEPIPLHQGAPGKVLLAFLPEDEREAVLGRPLEAANEHTIVDVDALGAEAADIRRRGFALSFGERVLGIHTVAVPIRKHDGSVTAALSVTGPAQRMPRKRLLEIVAPAEACAQGIAERLGYRGAGEEPS